MRVSLLLLLMLLMLLLLLMAAPLAAQPGEPPHHLVAVHVKDAGTLARAGALDLDVASCAGRELPVRVLEVIATDRDLARMRGAGLDIEILVENMERAAAARLASATFPFDLTPPPGKGAMGGHYTLDQIVAILDELTKQHPALCSPKVSLGKSHEGRDIWMLKISDNVAADEDEPEVLFDALHHAREPVGATATLQFMDWLASNYGKDADATFLVDNRELYFVPCVNPDGYEYNRRIQPGGGGMWRKNRRDNGNDVWGVDLNRNWPTGWSAPHGGNSRSLSSNTYRGPAPLSEPEVLALENFIRSRKLVLGVSTHTWSGMVLLRPWGYLPSPNEDPPNTADYRRISAQATAKNSAMRAGATSVLLYTAAGTTTDHCHAAHGMYAYLPELGGGFWPGPSEQVRLADLHRPMFESFARVAGAVLDVTGASLTEAPSGDGNGRIDPGEEGHVVATVANNGASSTRTKTTIHVRSLTTGVTVARAAHDLGLLARFTTTSNAASPLVVRVAPSFNGHEARLELRVDYDGITATRIFDLALEPLADLVGTDFETALGFTRATTDTASTGRFERGAPQRTIYQNRVIQPAGDHTSGNGTLCWVTDARAGSAAGTYDVDNGKTSFLSPPIDLRHVALPTLAFWLHYTESEGPQDPFTVEVSTQPNQWRTLYTSDVSTNGWTELSLRLPEPPTDTVQLRFTARDLTVSLVEACVDDLRLTGIAPAGAVTVLASGELGTTARVGLRGAAGAAGIPLLGTATAEITIPGIGGRLLIDPASLIVLPAVGYGPKDHANLDFPIPNAPRLAGVTIYWQQLLVHGATLAIGNRSALRLR